MPKHIPCMKYATNDAYDIKEKKIFTLFPDFFQ